jgi:hypothetical protein
LERINALIGACLRDPSKGTGKPEPLRQNLTGWSSRRITGEHRPVYRVRGSGEAQGSRCCRAGIIIEVGCVRQLRCRRQAQA